MLKRALCCTIAALASLAALPVAAQEPALELPHHMPSDPLFAGVVTIGDLSETLEELVGWLNRFDADVDVAEWEGKLAELEAEVGCSLRRDLLAQIGPELGFTFDLPPLDSIAEGMSDPAAAIETTLARVGIVAELRDPAAFNACLPRLMTHFDSSVVREGNVTHVVFAPPQGEGAPPLPFEPGFYYGIDGNVMSLGLARSYVQTTLARRAEGERLTDGADYKKVFAFLDPNPTRLTYFNTPRFRELIEGSGFVQSMVAADESASMMMELFLTPEFTASGIGSTAVDLEGGRRTATYAPSSLSGGSAYMGIMAAVMVPNLLDALDKAKRKRTIADVRNLGVALEALAADSGAYPGPTDGWVGIDEIAAALEPTYMVMAPREDGWGHALLYWSDGQSYWIVSPGKDGVPDRDWAAAALFDGEPSGDYETDVVFTDGRFVLADESADYEEYVDPEAISDLIETPAAGEAAAAADGPTR